MGWRFRKSFKILPGIRVNVGSRGVTSWSFGGRGAQINVGKRGTTTTISLPGTGLSYKTKTPPRTTRPAILAPKPIPQIAIQQSVPLSSPQKLPAIGSYVLVGVAALVAYLTLRPADSSFPAPASPSPAAYRPADPARVSPPSAPSISTPASAAALPSARLSQTGGTSPVLRVAVTTTGANVRSAPSMSGSIVHVLDGGASVRITATEGSWHRVLGEDGQPLGWVHGSILR